jgi:hypothetical protein
MLMTCVNVFVYDPKWASGSQLLLSSCLVYLMCYWQPQLEGWVNHVRTGMYTSVVWCSLLYVVIAFNLGALSVPSWPQWQSLATLGAIQCRSA